MSAADQAIIGGMLPRNLMEIDIGERQTLLKAAQEALRRVAQYPKPAAMVETVCNHPAQIIGLQKHIPYLTKQHFLPQECFHWTLEQQLETVGEQLEGARRTPREAGTDKDMRHEQDDMTHAASQSVKEHQALKTQLGNARSLVAWAALTPPLKPEERGQKFANSLDCSRSDRAQLTGWIAQL